MGKEPLILLFGIHLVLKISALLSNQLKMSGSIQTWPTLLIKQKDQVMANELTVLICRINREMFSVPKIMLTKIIFFAIPVLAAGLLGLFGLFDKLYAWHWQHVQLHSTIETLGGVTACLISILLFSECGKKKEAHLVMLATGFASMGVLDTAHAISKTGDAFIFLHSVAVLSGGIFFASVWFSHGRRIKGLFEQHFIFFTFIALSFSIGLRALLFPDDVPKIMPLFDGKFTMAAVLINLTASILFLVSVFKFYEIYRHEGSMRDLLFACLAFMFGIAAMLFPFSSLWDGLWWIWHLVRLAAFLTTLVFIVKQYRKHLHLKSNAGGA